MTDLEAAKMRHPACGPAVVERITTPGRVFLDALENLTLVVELYGPDSPQALFARRAVDAARTLAIETSRDGPSAA